MCICFADVFLCFFVFFPSVKNMRQPFSGMAERIFMKLLPNDGGDVVWNVVPPTSEWQMLICVIYADSAAAIAISSSELCMLWLWQNHQRAPRTAVALYNHERANGCNLVFRYHYHGFLYLNFSFRKQKNDILKYIQGVPEKNAQSLPCN